MIIDEDPIDKFLAVFDFSMSIHEQQKSAIDYAVATSPRS